MKITISQEAQDYMLKQSAAATIYMADGGSCWTAYSKSPAVYAGKPKSNEETYQQMDYEGLKLYVDEAMVRKNISIFFEGWWIFKRLVISTSPG